MSHYDMKPTSVEEEFVSLVRATVAPHHGSLQFTAPSSNYTAIHGATGPAPDLIVKNSVTGETVIAEVKAADPNRPISFSVLPTLKLMNAAFRDPRVRLIVFALGEVPSSVRSGLEADNIRLEDVRSVEDAAQRLDALVREIE